MTSMKEIEELYNQLKKKGYDNVFLNKGNLSISFDETHFIKLSSNCFIHSWGLYDVVRARSPNVVYAFDGNNTLTISTPFYEDSINLDDLRKEIKYD